MKNAHLKNKSAKLIDFLKQLTNGTSSPVTAANLHLSKREKYIRAGFIVLCGLIASLSIQREFGAGQLAGGFLISCLLLVILYRDILRYKPAYVIKLNMVLLLGLLIIGTLLTGRLFGYLLTTLSKGLEYKFLESSLFGVPIPAGAMFVSLIFDFHTAITFSFAVSLLSGLWVHDASFTIYAFVGSITGGFWRHEVQKAVLPP